MTPITFSSDQPTDYGKAIDAALTPEDLRSALLAWKNLAADALAVAETMTAEDFEVFRAGLRKERKGRFAGDEWAIKYGAILMPEVMFKVSMVASQFHVPWGLAYKRLEETGRLATL
jgi:hypothetical protein